MISSGRFAAKEGKGGGEFYTPQDVFKLLIDVSIPDRHTSRLQQYRLMNKDRRWLAKDGDD